MQTDDGTPTSRKKSGPHSCAKLGFLCWQWNRAPIQPHKITPGLHLSRGSQGDLYPISEGEESAMTTRWWTATLLATLWITALRADQRDVTIPQAPPASPSAAAPIAPPNTLPVQLPGQLSIDWATPLRVERIDKPKEAGINWGTVISSLVAASVGAGGALIVGLWSQRGIRRSLSLSVNASELKDLQTKLNTFYGPYMQRSEINRLLAEEFKSHQTDPVSFRTLTLLLDPAWRNRLSKSDQTIVGEIVKNDVALNALIHEHTGLVDSQVMNYLSRAGAHFRLIELAFEGQLENLPKRFDPYVYPKQLDEVLRLEIRRLTDRCENLRSKATEWTGAMPPLEIPNSLQLPPWPPARNAASGVS
jgi:hypothetical protein